MTNSSVTMKIQQKKQNSAQLVAYLSTVKEMLMIHIGHTMFHTMLRVPTPQVHFILLDNTTHATNSCTYEYAYYASSSSYHYYHLPVCPTPLPFPCIIK